MWNTYYYLARQADHPGRADTTLFDAKCRPIARVTRGFSDSVCVEGSGILADGRVINYARRCSCGRPCRIGGTICYVVLDKKKFPWGMGSRDNPLVPLRSWAVDNKRVPHGTRLYAERWDGVTIPSVDGLGGFVHDGCFRADDVGTSIRGDHVDIFAGTRAMWLALEKLVETKSTFTVYADPPSGRCR
jgi:3D (Asp-Asp-Asp) domain-containing protein